jgi:hypothetical protein
MITDRQQIGTPCAQFTACGMLIAVVALCCACSALPSGAVDAAHLIRPGVGIGPIHVGATLADAERAWGPPTERQPVSEDRSPTNDFTNYSWTNVRRSDVEGLAIDVLDSTGTIIRVSVTRNRWYATAGGSVMSAGANWIGSTPAQVHREFGAPEPSRDVWETLKLPVGTAAWHYYRRGIHFYFSTSDLSGSEKPGDLGYVYMIIVTAPNAALP